LGPLSMTSLTGSGTTMSGAVVLGMGCHSGLPAPSSEARPQDVAETLLGLGASAVVGQYGYGWGLEHGGGLAAGLMHRFAWQLVSAPSVVLGDALVTAKRDYYLGVHRYDVFDHKVLQQTVCQGLPMLRIDSSGSARPPAAPQFKASERDGSDQRSGVTVTK